MSDKTTVQATIETVPETSPESLLQTGTLPGGVVADGVRHRAFTLRLPTVRDNISAVDEVGSSNGVALNAALLARQITRLGTLDGKAINFDLVAGLHPTDYNALDAAARTLEKKRWAALAAASATSASASPSSAPD